MYIFWPRFSFTTDDLSDSSCNERDKAGDNSDSGNSTQNSVSSTESVLSLHPDDIEFDDGNDDANAVLGRTWISGAVCVMALKCTILMFW